MPLLSVRSGGIVSGVYGCVGVARNIEKLEGVGVNVAIQLKYKNKDKDKVEDMHVPKLERLDAMLDYFHGAPTRHLSKFLLTKAL